MALPTAPVTPAMIAFIVLDLNLRWLHFQIRNKGISIPTNDLRVASLAVQHSLVLCTSDRHFQQLPQVVTC